jgi:hypothetical protein
VISPDARPQPPSIELVPPQVEEVPVATTTAEASITPPLPAFGANEEEIETTAEASAPRTVMETSAKADPSS